MRFGIQFGARSPQRQQRESVQTLYVCVFMFTQASDAQIPNSIRLVVVVGAWHDVKKCRRRAQLNDLFSASAAATAAAHDDNN